MKQLVIVSAILALAAPAFCEVLVYKQTTTFNPMVSYSDVSHPRASVNKVALQSYIVFDMDPRTYDIRNSTDLNSPQNPNSPTAIFFGTLTIYKFKDQMTLGGDDANHPNSYVNVSVYNDANCMVPFRISNKGDAPGTFVIIDINDTWMDFRVLTKMFGANKPTAINASTQISLPKSFKGDADLVSSERAGGFGTAKATLDSKYTKYANTSPAKTVKQVVTQIQNDLRAKGYRWVDELPGFPCECSY